MTAVAIRVVFAALVLMAVCSDAQRQPLGATNTTLEPRESAARLTGDVEHGRYLVEHVAMCVECHSTRDELGHIITAKKYMGGTIPFRPPWPNNWAPRAPRNGGLPGYTDEQALRLLTRGAINREGRQLRPPMPRFQMTTEDAADVIAYLRAIQ